MRPVEDQALNRATKKNQTSSLAAGGPVPGKGKPLKDKRTSVV